MAYATPRTNPTVDCPRCGAPAGYPCNADAEGEALHPPHRERQKAEAAALWQDIKGAAWDAKTREMRRHGI